MEPMDLLADTRRYLASAIKQLEAINAGAPIAEPVTREQAINIVTEHGPMWDLAEDENSIKLVESFLAAGKTFALVCHSSGALRHVKTPDGKLLVEGKTVTGFTNGEEEEVGLTKVVPFLVEDELMSLGATFSKVKNWGVHTIADGQLITGQNPASSGPTACVLIETPNKAK